MSIQWRGDELAHDDRTTMMDAAENALRILKLDHLQAIIVAHNDTAHPHVHVVVNRVNPETGIMTAIAAPDVRKLNKWADAFEVGRGFVVSPNRRRKYARAEHAAEPEETPQSLRIELPPAPLGQDLVQPQRGFLSRIFDQTRVRASLVRKWRAVSGMGALQEHYSGGLGLFARIVQGRSPAIHEQSAPFIIAKRPIPFERTFNG